MEKNNKKLLISTVAGLVGLVLASSGKINNEPIAKDTGILLMTGTVAYMWYQGLKKHLEIDRQYRDTNYQTL